MIDIRKLTISFERNGHYQPYIRDVSFQLAPGKILGIVGESGSGKSIANYALMGLLPEYVKVDAEKMTIFGNDLLCLKRSGWNHFRGNICAMIFQDPMTALNPALSIKTQLIEVLRKKHPNQSRRKMLMECERLLEEVGIKEPAMRLTAYPHELSGGMAQRVMIAMALACEPKLLIADEPTTALDAVVQKQILDLLIELRDRRDMSIILVSHDIGIIRRYSDQMIVMYSGQIVESGATSLVIQQPYHPYTQGLMSALPDKHILPKATLATIPGSVIPIYENTKACRFHERCNASIPQCRVEPILKELRQELPASPARKVRCHM